MSRMIICARCPTEIYAPHQIKAYLRGEEATTLADLQPGGSTGGRPRGGRRSLWRAFLGGPTARDTSPIPDPRGLERLRDYTFRCPEGHPVDGNQGIPFGLAVLGPSSASKSHMLPAIVHELDDESALRRVGVTLSDALYGDPQLKADRVQVYQERSILDATDVASGVIGPYASRLLIGQSSGDPYATNYSLLLYDVAGEKLSSVVNIVESAAFAILAKALLVLIDPVDFLPTQFDGASVISERARATAATSARNSIRVIADTLTEVYGVRSSKFLPTPICFVIAKSDAIEWTGGFDWAGQTERVLNAANDGSDLAAALLASSEETREALQALGGDRVVQEIEDRFDGARVRFAAASATSAMPIEDSGPHDSSWSDDPRPNGVALSVLHALNLAGIVPQPSLDANDADGDTSGLALDSV